MVLMLLKIDPLIVCTNEVMRRLDSIITAIIEFNGIVFKVTVACHRKARSDTVNETLSKQMIFLFHSSGQLVTFLYSGFS